MKQPRIDAFVPKKQTVPELKSSLEHMPAIEKPPPLGMPGCDRAIPNLNLLIKSLACKIKYLLRNIVLLYSPGSYANTLDAGP
jgi:hypothetical protein